VPEELAVLLAAETFHVLPEEIEERMTPLWWDLWLCLMQERNRRG
jgi:hypothetical protein